MIITRTAGGTGNQLFQYALGRTLAEKYKVPLLIDNDMQKHLSENGFFKRYKNIFFRKYTLDNFTISANLANRSQIPWYLRNFFCDKIRSSIDGVRRRIFLHKGREKIPYQFDKKILEIGPDVYLDGDWQSYKYFEKYSEIIKKELQLKISLPENIIKLGKKIKLEKSLCLHVRRGDYVNNSYHGVLENNYYTQAFQYIKNNFETENIYIFSDDIEWCKINISFDIPTFYVDDEYKGKDDLGHFWLMQQCKYFIIVNSSFSWWAAWLAERPEKIVITPKNWVNDDSINTKDLIPPEWIRL